MRVCDRCEHYLSGEICGHPSIIEVDMGGKGDTFSWIDETPSWCPLVEVADRKTKPQTDGYMTAEQAEDYRKMLDKAEHKVYGNIEDEPQTDCAWK